MGETGHERFTREHPDVERVELLVVDVNGIPRGKSLPIADLAKLHGGEVTLPRGAILLDTFGRASPRVPYGYPDGDPDRPVMPVPGTLAAMPWARRPTAQVLALIADPPGTPWFVNPRVVLERCLDGFASLGLRPVVALELEFHLLRAEGRALAPLETLGEGPGSAGPQTYNPELLADFTPFIEAVHEAAEALGLPTGGVLSEYGAGQFEINLHHHDDVLRACDEALLLRRAVRGCARRLGCLASFMAKPLADDSGNGLHVHASLLDARGDNVFASDEGEALAAPLRHAVAGLLESLPESLALLAPNANAYRRFEPGGFVPTAADWGLDHRGVAVRVPSARGAGTRFEHRVAGADANPYLVTAAVLAGALHGLERAREPIAPTEGSSTSPDAAALPKRWHEALARLAEGRILPPRLGEDFCALYRTVKEDEEAADHRAGHALDIDRYARTL